MMMFHNRHRMPFHRPSAGHIAAHIGMAVALGAVLIFGLGYAVMLLWNTVMPPLLGVGHLTFRHSIALLLLARILVGGFHHGGRHRAFRGRFGHRGAWQQYEEWWREAGEQSYRDFATSRAPHVPGE